ncbi:hypothetical protein HEP86_19240 [Streptomyces sp. RPA4-5]|uniref:hypothetical protein n=1 Tax=Streptomyces sp. RPA4-5 TaxID=2721245 RepID=UPI00143EAEBE|nr:hypothetical protein [Streptomyces sp. RPA4-5]QIY56271.1 hypothetical protein HEP86_19240 [Streptomyces sp. RPA4-5]
MAGALGLAEYSSQRVPARFGLPAVGTVGKCGTDRGGTVLTAAEGGPGVDELVGLAAQRVHFSVFGADVGASGTLEMPCCFSQFVPCSSEEGLGEGVGLLVRIWCGTPELVQATNKAQVADLGLNYGAGDGNRTRALSLGINGVQGGQVSSDLGKRCSPWSFEGCPWYPS